MDDTPDLDPVETLTPFPQPEYTEAPTPVPSSKVPLEQDTKSETQTPTPTEKEVVEYDGPAKTGKTLKDLAMDLGAPDSVGSLIDEMQEAIIGITGDLVNNTSGRTSIADILGHENRLRGIGALFVLAALVGMMFDSISGESLIPPVTL